MKIFKGIENMAVLALFLMLAALSGCAETAYVKARVYNIHTGQLMEVELYDYAHGHGKVTAALSHGRVLDGTYAIVPAERLEAGPPGRPPQMLSATLTSVPSEAAPSADRGNENSLPEGYGTGASAGSDPALTALSIGDRGRVLEMIVEHGSTDDANGDGVARDAHGRWYRVQMRGAEN